jgi:hypothetical protein
MAKKLKLMSLFQELQGRAQLTNRRPTPSSTGVYLMQLRAQAGVTTLPRRRLSISVELQSPPVAPHPVKIHHARPSEGEAAPAPDDALRPAPAGGPRRLPQVRPAAD